MDQVQRIFLSNLPSGISEERLSKELKRVFRKVSGIKSFSVRVFKPDGLKQKAVAFGFRALLSDIQEAATSETIEGRTIRVFPDEGDDRDDFGNFVIPKGPEQIRSLKKARGEWKKKCTALFSEKFWNSIDRDVYDGVSESVVFKGSLDIKELKKVSKVVYATRIGKDRTQIQFGSVLDTLQAIRYFNLNEFYEFDVDGLFQNKSGTSSSTIMDCEPLLLEKNEKILTIKDAADQNVVEIAKLDPEVVNPSVGDFKATCLRCKQRYTLIGVEINLNYLTGRCSCSYDWDLDVLDKNRAFMWPGESFTRLMLASAFSTELVVQHIPMKHGEPWDSPQEYRNVVLPLLYSEWKAGSGPFKIENKTEGHFVDLTLIEVIKDDEKDTSDDVYGVQIMLQKTKFWQMTNRLAISHLTLEFHAQKKYSRNPPRRFERKVKVLRMHEVKQPESGLVLSVQFSLEHGYIPIRENAVVVTPKMEKSQYNTNKKVINKWASGKIGNAAAQKIFLDPSRDQNWQRNIGTIPKRKVSYADKHKLQTFHKRLNEEQKDALVHAVQCNCSFLHGPPGCGKTFSLAKIATTLNVLEEGKIVATAPSNVACDGICRAIKNNGMFSSKVLRIYAKGRENALLDGGQGIERPDTGFDKLHEMVRQSENWLNTPVLRRINAKILRGDRYKLTRLEDALFTDHVESIEFEVMSRYDILVSTFGALCDHRIKRFCKTGLINTVLADEIGQASQPDTLPLFLLQAKRYCFIGDHLQLSAGVRSEPIRLAGLGMSVMEFVDNVKRRSGLTTIPWTTLCEQRRMAPRIRELVSRFTYDDKLRDASEILSRTYCYDKIAEAFGVQECDLGSVLVVDKDDPEQKRGTSFRNEGQCERIIRIVTKLMDTGIPSEDLTILTLYEAQRALIEKQLRKNGFESVQVKNVDGFQGRENEIIILSMTRCNEDGQLGFTSDRNRLNVALSRARFQLIIFMSKSTIAANHKQTWNKLADLLEELANFVDL